MLRTRLWMGAILVGLIVGVLAIDRQFHPWYPFLLLLTLAMGLAGCVEMVNLLSVNRRPPRWLCYGSVAGLVASNWVVHVWPAAAALDRDPWHWVLGSVTAVVLIAFLAEMAVFLEPGESLTRIGFALLIACYLGLLPSFFAQLRWLSSGVSDSGTTALALAIFVPKCCDIGAYFTGRAFGRRPMTPVLSPKKTWEGAAGGLAASVATAIAINRFATVPALPSVLAEVGFGLTVGVAGMLGDLAESLIKRDCRQKDASQTVPGFGGILDIVDSVIFAAPVAYCWLRFS